MNRMLNRLFLALALIQADSQVYGRRGLRRIDGNKRTVNRSIVSKACSTRMFPVAKYNENPLYLRFSTAAFYL